MPNVWGVLTERKGLFGDLQLAFLFFTTLEVG
jgi:hypothetical protein